MSELRFSSVNEALQHLADVSGKSIRIAADSGLVIYSSGRDIQGNFNILLGFEFGKNKINISEFNNAKQEILDAVNKLKSMTSEVITSSDRDIMNSLKIRAASNNVSIQVEVKGKDPDTKSQFDQTEFAKQKNKWHRSIIK